MTRARQSLGRSAERIVAARLRSAGWRLLVANARTASGEIDLIALDRSTLVFVEVKAGRAGSVAGPERPAHAVGPRKQRKLRRVAREWLADGGASVRVDGYRFDVVGVTLDGPGRVCDYEHLRNAF